jgi:hypothetical protein
MSNSLAESFGALRFTALMGASVKRSERSPGFCSPSRRRCPVSRQQTELDPGERAGKVGEQLCPVEQPGILELFQVGQIARLCRKPEVLRRFAALAIRQAARISNCSAIDGAGL